MDKVFSTRLDENIISQINMFVKDKGISKKSLIQTALKSFFEEAGSSVKADIIKESCGSWVRDEAEEVSWRKIRKTFNRGYSRHHHRDEIDDES